MGTQGLRSDAQPLSLGLVDYFGDYNGSLAVEVHFQGRSFSRGDYRCTLLVNLLV